MANVMGPGGSTSKAGCKTGMSQGPGGPGGGGHDVTTRRGYEARRTTGLRDVYKQTGRAESGKAGR